MKYGTQTERIKASVGEELKENPPAVLSSTARKFGLGRAEKQRKAILLSKARRLGAKIKGPKLGSKS